MSRDVDGDDTFGVASLLAAVAAPKVGDRTKALDRLCAWLDNAGNRALLDNAGGSEVRNLRSWSLRASTAPFAVSSLPCALEVEVIVKHVLVHAIPAASRVLVSGKCT